MIPPQIDVVVPVYNKWELTRSCLQYLAAQTEAHQVTVVDDASSDGTAERVRREFPDVRVVQLPNNSGFAAAVNRGIQEGSRPFVVLVNNDVSAAPTLLAELVEPLRSDPRVASVAALLRRPDGAVDSFGICADATMAGFIRGHGAILGSSGDPLPELLGPYGAVAAYRRSALDEVGVLDEGIRMYGEELDLALRLRAAGWLTASAPRAQGVHLGGATAGKGSARQRYLAGYGRGYLLRSYRVLASPHSPRALLTEALVCVAGALIARDTADLRGRLAGWRAGRGAASRLRPTRGIDRGIGFVRSLRMRRPAYWTTLTIPDPAEHEPVAWLATLPQPTAE